MKTKTINLYEFKELSKEAQDKAIEKFRFINVDGDYWYYYELDVWKEKLNEAGFEGAEIHFSGFYSQGDGASFDANIKIEKFTNDKRIIALAELCDFRIEKNSYSNHYSHERTRYVEYNGIDTKRQTNIAKALADLSDKIESERYSLSKQIYRSLNDNYDYLTGNEAIIETIESNEYTFTEDGELEN